MKLPCQNPRRLDACYRAIAGLFATVCVAVLPAAETVSYRETFNNSTATADLGISSQAGWNFYVHNGSGVRTTVSGSSNAGINNNTGSPASAAPIASGASATEAQGLFRTFSGTSGPMVLLTSEPVSLDVGSVLRLQWYQGNASANTALRALIQVGGVTYVSDAGATNPAVSAASGFAAGAVQRSFTLAGATWKTLNFASGQAMTLSTGAATLPSTGTVTAVGLYWDIDSSSSARVDTFEIVTGTVVQNTAPVITTQPVSAVVTSGGSASFTVAATGTPAPTYQWKKNGVAIAGQTAATLSFATVASGDAASYTVEVINSVSTVTSNAATLTVNPVPPAETVSYRETFNNNTATADLGISSQAGWGFYVQNSSGVRVSVSGTSNAGINNNTGSPASAAPIASGDTATEAKGLFRTFSGTSGPMVLLTSEPVSLDVGSVLRLQWYQGNASANTALRALIQVGGVTYVSDAGATNPAVSSAAGFAAGAVQRVFTLAGATWKTLSLASGQAMTLSTGAATLPSTGTVTAVGLYWDIDSSSSARVDTFEIVTGSGTPPPAATVVSGPWSGNVTSSSATVNAGVSASGVTARLVVATNAALNAPLYGASVTSAGTAGNAVRLDITGLAPDTDYYYALELNGVRDLTPGRTGRFRTAPVGAASYTFAFASCGDSSNTTYQYTYAAIQNDAPRFFLHMGDMNYQDTNSTDPAAYRANYVTALSLAEQGALYRRLPIAYVWDDHDFSGNDSDRTSTGRTAHRQVYRERVPHYSLPAGTGDAAIYQRFDYGRVRYLITDLRSERDPATNTDNAAKTMMGTAQKAWFKDQLLQARNDEVRLIVWVSSVPFVSSSTTQDNWGSYTTERRELADFMAANRIRNVVILSGDMHGLAYDDGTNSDYSTGGVLPAADHPKIFQAAAMTRTGSFKGGPYSGGSSIGAGRYGLFAINDTGGDTLQATFTGRIATTATAVTDWASYTFTSRVPVPRAPASVGVSSGTEGLLVQWSDLSGVETGYRVERSADGTTGWTTVATKAANATSHLDTDVVSGATWFYRVVPFNATGDGIASAVQGGTYGGALTFGRPLYEAETASLTGASTASANAGYSGAGYVTFANASGDFVEWSVTMPLAGSYDLVVRYANGSGASRNLALTLNGTANGTLNFPATANWTTWTTLRQQVTVPAGVSTVRLSTNGSVGPALDKLDVAYRFPNRDALAAQANLPDPFLMYSGSRLASTADWPKQQHYLKEMLQHYLYGQLPPAPTTMTFTTVAGSEKTYTTANGTVANEKTVRITVNGFSFDVHVYVPATGSATWPVIVRASWTHEPQLDSGFQYSFNVGGLNRALDRGYALLSFDAYTVAIDEGAGSTDRSLGIYPAFPAYDFGAVAAWAYALQRMVDYAATQSWADMSKVIATGHSRLGKATLCAAVNDERIALAAPSGSGQLGGGCIRFRGNKTGAADSIETYANVHNTFSHWFNAESKTFNGYETRIPYDSHFMKGVLAGRAVITLDGYDDTWANPYGAQLTFWAAEEVFTWLGQASNIAAHYRSGGHGFTPDDMTALLDFADEHFYGIPSPQDLRNIPVPAATRPYTWTRP